AGVTVNGDGSVTLTNAPGFTQTQGQRLRAQAVTGYDEQGRAYQSLVYDVNPVTGAVSSTALTTNNYYDHRGEEMAVSAPGGLWTKRQYDGARRATLRYSTDGAGGTTWSAAAGVSADTVLEQTQQVYDGTRNVVATVRKQRFDDATGTGALGSPTTAPT